MTQPTTSAPTVPVPADRTTAELSPAAIRMAVDWLWAWRNPLLAAILVPLSLLTRAGLSGWEQTTLVLLSPVAAGLVAWRYRAPVTVAAVLAVVFHLTAYYRVGNAGVLLALAIALYALGASRAPALALQVGTGLLFGYPLGAWVIGKLTGKVLYHPYDPNWKYESYVLYDHTLGGTFRITLNYLVDPRPVAAASVPLLVVLVAGMLARQIRLDRQQERATRERVRVASGQAETERRVLLEERAAIARDLHDSVAHHVNLMVIQAESGPDLVRLGEAEVLRGFGVIGDAGRRALAELDRTLAALREDAGAQLSPQPRLDDLPALVAGTAAQGLTVDLEWSGEQRPLDPAVELAAYRIVQESLTNAVRHAQTGQASVRLEYQPDGLALQIVDRGAGFDPTVSPAGRGGHGLAGMRERARVHGGTLAIASMPGAGTAISAFLPAAG